MRAKEQVRLSDKRSDLGEKAPLSAPYVLLIDPSNLCNFRCEFCPSGHDDLIQKTGRRQQILDFDLFRKIIDETNHFEEQIRVLRMYKEGEPLVNPNFTRMVCYAKEHGNIGRIDTTTNGALLSPKLNQAIIDSGIDQINISVNGVSDKMMLKYTKKQIDFENYVNNIRDLYERKKNCTIYIKAIKDNLSPEEQDKFYDLFGNISDRIFLERISPAWPRFHFGRREEFDAGNYGQEIEDRSVCPYLFYVLVINSDGTVSSCVGDWQHKQIIGDINKESLKDIWYGKCMEEYWNRHLKGDKNYYFMCSQCEVLQYGAFDNVDSHASKILERLQLGQYQY